MNNEELARVPKMVAETEDPSYDGTVKSILSERLIAAYIAQQVVPEYQSLKLDEVAQLIPGYIPVSVEPINPDETVKMENTEDTLQNEGTIRFDIKFLSFKPENKEKYHSVLNYEVQRNEKTDYPLDNRAIYYYARAISREYLTVMGGKMAYEKMVPVYSVWFILNGQYQNRIESISMKRIIEHGTIKPGEKSFDPDMGKILFVYLSDPQHVSNKLLKTMDTLLYLKRETNKQLKLDTLKEMGIPITQSIERKVGTMTTLEEGLKIDFRNEGLAEGRAEGRAEGIDEGKTFVFSQYIGVKIKNKFSIHQIVCALMKDFGISEKEALDYVTKYNK